MQDEDTPLTIVNEAAIAAAELRHDPYDYCFVDDALPQSRKQRVLDDAPVIPGFGGYGLADLEYGPEFGKVVDELLSDRFRSLVERKFDIDLGKCPPGVVMTGDAGGHDDEGRAHPDSKRAIVSVLVGFSREWPGDRGKLKVLRADDRDDFAFEYAPEYGKMLMFRVCEHARHGFLPQRGRRASLELSYVDSDRRAKRDPWRRSWSAYARSPLLRKAIALAPRRFFAP